MTTHVSPTIPSSAAADPASGLGSRLLLQTLPHCANVLRAPVAEILPDKLKRYLARIDQELPGLKTDIKRRIFLEVQRNKFEDEYTHFRWMVDAGRYAGTATAADYVTTIAELDKRLAALPAPPCPY